MRINMSTSFGNEGSDSEALTIVPSDALLSGEDPENNGMHKDLVGDYAHDTEAFLRD